MFVKVQLNTTEQVTEYLLQKNILTKWHLRADYDQSRRNFRVLLNEAQLKEPITLYIIHAGGKKNKKSKKRQSLQ